MLITESEEDNMNSKETAREYYLEKFKRENPVSNLFGSKSAEVGTKLVEVMKKEDLTYDEAYASLQYAYNLIKYESNFLKLQ